ncbi:lysophospholipid acyltransferase family protein [Pedobacter sp. SL55]|uniref:lysophospholipid acyltransferase family protein n=1 Tax=Pedobacter sp. SL55 TaxID=2995161 RepID=UPI00226F2C18|nr:lysophospholipid acyltransferase family protein [Pedobacter sp. SL55]WAC39881.1 lysophospholipid acyltransferase family protein [Pedobacter sp. SL55]
MIKLLRRIHLIYSLVCILLFFILFLPFYYCFTRHPKYYGILNKFRTAHAWISSTLAGFFLRFKFEKKLDPNQTYIFCANHTSNLDIIIMCALARGRYHFMGKEELMKNPILGIFFKTIDIAVSRSSKISSFRAFKKAADNLEKGMSLIIFPEGKIDDVYPPVLQDFKSGPFRLAIEKNIPIVPVSIANLWKMMWDDGFKHGTRPGIVDIYVHEPILTSTLAVENDEVLKEDVYKKIYSKL